MKDINFINSMPPKKQIQILIFIKTFIILIIFFIISLSIIFFKKQQFKKEKKLILEKVNVAKTLLENKKNLDMEKAILENKIEKIKNLGDRTQDLYNFLEKLFEIIPKKISITKLEYIDKAIKLAGTSKNIKSITKLLENNSDLRLINISSEKNLFNFNIFRQKTF
jgi:Tfp pilus assembly protein PilN